MKIPDETHQRQLFLQQIYDVRVKSGIRQVDLAEKLAVPQSFISKYESGDRRLDILEIRRICQICGISLTEFVTKLEVKLNETER